MAKAYWVVCYRSIRNPDALAAYAKIAGPAVQAGGGRFLVRGTPAKTYEGGLNQRTVVVEFDSLDKAIRRARQSRLPGSAARSRRRRGPRHAGRRSARLTGRRPVPQVFTNSVTSGCAPRCALQCPCTLGSKVAPSGRVSAEKKCSPGLKTPGAAVLQSDLHFSRRG